METKRELEYCFIVPILPDKVTTMRDFWREAATKKAGAIKTYIHDVGQTRVLAFLDTGPQGNFLTQYIRGSTDLRTAFMKNRDIDLPVADFIRSAFEDFAGYDFTLPENSPDLEPLFDWTAGKTYDEASAKHGIYVIKLLPGIADEVMRFYAGFKEERRMRELEQYLEGKILKVLSFLQHRPEGDYVVEYIVSSEDIEEMAEKLMRSDLPVIRLMRDAFMRFSGLDLTKPENMPKLELLFDSGAVSDIHVGEAVMARQ
jgi:hypothetical protein